MNFITRKPVMRDRLLSIFAIFALLFSTSGVPTTYAVTLEFENENPTSGEVVVDLLSAPANPGQCPDGYTKLMETYTGGITWTADANYSSVILVGGPDDLSLNKDPDGRDKYFYNVKMGDTITRTEHDISHICATSAVVQTGSITVTKEVLGYDGYWSFEFTGVEEGFTLTNTNKSKTFEALATGPYTITETAVDGFSYLNVSCEGAEVLADNTTNGIMFDLQAEEHVSCTFTNSKDPKEEEVNTCLIPSVVGHVEPFAVGASNETPLQTILNNTYGGGVVHVNADQMNYQVWDLASSNADYVNFDITILGKEASNVQTFGYYKAEDTASFVPLVTIPPTGVGVAIRVAIPTSLVDSIGFAIETTGLETGRWYSEYSLNPESKDNVAVYNPSPNTYVLAFEDQKDGDDDYNDLVVEIKDVTCTEDTTPKEDITMCKYDTAGAPQTGWGMILSNGVEGGTHTHHTLDNGCVTVSVNPTEGPWTVMEEERANWSLESIVFHNGEAMLDGDGITETGCRFFTEEAIEETLALDDGDRFLCAFTNQRNESGGTGEIINSCFLPSTGGRDGAVTIGTSYETSLPDILSNYGYGFIDIISDQKNYQTWTFAHPSIEQVTFDITVLGKYADNRQAFIYYEAENGTEFVPLFQTSGHSAGLPEINMSQSISVTIPRAFATTVGFAIQTEGDNTDTWHSEPVLNREQIDNVAVYNPESNTFILAFEDRLDYDNDYNDLVIKIGNMECGEIPQNGEDGETGIIVRSAGGGGGCINCDTRSVEDSSESLPEGEARGESDRRDTGTASTQDPEGDVRGDQVSVVPLGAANTGAGGTSQTTLPMLGLFLLTLGIGVLRRVQLHA